MILIIISIRFLLDGFTGNKWGTSHFSLIIYSNIVILGYMYNSIKKIYIWNPQTMKIISFVILNLRILKYYHISINVWYNVLLWFNFFFLTPSNSMLLLLIIDIKDDSRIINFQQNKRINLHCWIWQIIPVYFSMSAGSYFLRKRSVIIFIHLFAL